jgi:amidase
MARSVADAAAVLSIIAGPDRLDNYTDSEPTPIPDYTKALHLDALKGKRLGVPRHVFLNSSIANITQPELDAFKDALHILQNLGAVIVDPADMPSADKLLTEKYGSLVNPTAFKVCNRSCDVSPSLTKNACLLG